MNDIMICIGVVALITVELAFIIAGAVLAMQLDWYQSSRLLLSFVATIIAFCIIGGLVIVGIWVTK